MFSMLPISVGPPCGGAVPPLIRQSRTILTVSRVLTIPFARKIPDNEAPAPATSAAAADVPVKKV